MARYWRLDRGGDLFVWDKEDEVMYKLNPGTGDYVRKEMSLMMLYKQGYLEDLGEVDEFPGNKFVPVPEGDDERLKL